MNLSSEMSEKATKPKLLVVCDPQRQNQDFLDSLGPEYEIFVVENAQQAFKLLREYSFDAVFSDQSGFPPLEQAAVSQQAVDILNTIDEAVCIVSGDGTLLWANRKAGSFPEPIRIQLAELSKKGYDFFNGLISKGRTARDGQWRPRKYSLTDEATDRYFEMAVTPMTNQKGQLGQVAVVIWEETSSRRLRKRIEAIDSAGRELVRLEAEAVAEMTVEQRIQVVQDKIVRYARKLLHFDHFVVRIWNRQNNKLEVLFGVDLPADEQTEVFVSPDNNGISGYVASTGRSYICNNPEIDVHYLPGLDGVRCSLTVPLRLHDRIIGTMNVESHQAGAFGEDDRQMAEILGRYIAIALNILDLLVVQRYQTTGETSQNLNQCVSEPLNDIVSEAAMLLEDYIGHDDIRHRLQKVIDLATQIKSGIRQVRSAPKGILGAKPGKPAYGDQKEFAGRHFLVVDDEHFIRQTVADVVEQYGCLTDIACDGREALAMLKQKKYDLVISDIKMPFASGYEIFAAARDADQSTPVILMTGFGYDPGHSIVRANREGLSAVLYKPFKVDQLLGEIRKALDVTRA